MGSIFHFIVISKGKTIIYHLSGLQYDILQAGIDLCLCHPHRASKVTRGDRATEIPICGDGAVGFLQSTREMNGSPETHEIQPCAPSDSLST